MKTNNIKKIIITLIILLLGYNSYFVIKDRNYNNQTHIYCGNVVEKVLEEKYHKSRYSHTERYLIIDFGKNGIHSVQANTNTYFTTKVGKTVCFEMSNKQMGKDVSTNIFMEILFIVFLTILTIGILYFIFELSSKLF
jgi:hypothetical protein